MSWKALLASRTVQPHKTSKKEIESLRKLVARDLADAAIEELSADRRFATAYNAVLQLSKMAIACAGYRVSAGTGQHQKSFEAVKVALGKPSEPLADYFETCRRKRNNIDYDSAEVTTETEAQELLQRASGFREMIEEWIAKRHPAFSKAEGSRQ
jgi:uncharacterized protein (UPF0332 family)